MQAGGRVDGDQTSDSRGSGKPYHGLQRPRAWYGTGLTHNVWDRQARKTPRHGRTRAGTAEGEVYRCPLLVVLVCCWGGSGGGPGDAVPDLFGPIHRMTCAGMNAGAFQGARPWNSDIKGWPARGTERRGPKKRYRRVTWAGKQFGRGTLGHCERVSKRTGRCGPTAPHLHRPYTLKTFDFALKNILPSSPTQRVAVPRGRADQAQ